MRKWFALAALVAVTACSGGDSPTAPPVLTMIRIENRSALTIDEVYYSDCAAVEWGPNRLAAGTVVTAGADRDFAVAAGCYDVGLIAVDGREWSLSGVQITVGVIQPVRVTNF